MAGPYSLSSSTPGGRARRTRLVHPHRPLQLAGARPTRPMLRRDGGLWAYETALARAGFPTVAGADEAGRGACAGPLVVAACVLPVKARAMLDGLTDSKLLTAAARDRFYDVIVERATAFAVVAVGEQEIDAYGLHVANLSGMRRAVHRLGPSIDYTLTDGFAVSGLGVPATAVWKGDASVACIAAASVLAKVTRDRIMSAMHDTWPQYDFARHKGYVTAEHAAALHRHGPSPVHRQSYVNVRRAWALAGGLTTSPQPAFEPTIPGTEDAGLGGPAGYDDNDLLWNDDVVEDIA